MSNDYKYGDRHCPYCLGTNGGHYDTCKAHPVSGTYKYDTLMPVPNNVELIDKAELAELRRDAERWKWARSNPDLWPLIGRQVIADEYADAAIAAQTGEKL